MTTEQAERLLAVLDRIAAALEAQNDPTAFRASWQGDPSTANTLVEMANDPESQRVLRELRAEGWNSFR